MLFHRSHRVIRDFRSEMYISNCLEYGRLVTFVMYFGHLHG